MESFHNYMILTANSELGSPATLEQVLPNCHGWLSSKLAMCLALTSGDFNKRGEAGIPEHEEYWFQLLQFLMILLGNLEAQI